MIIGQSRAASLPPLPTTGMTMNFDFSDISTLYKTFTTGNNPDYSNVATADGDVIQVARSIFPVATSDWTLPYTNSDATRSPILELTTPLLKAPCLAFDGSNDRLFVASRTGPFVGASSILSTTAFTILISFRPASVPSNPGNQALFSSSDPSALWGCYVTNTGTPHLRTQNHTATGYDNADGTDQVFIDTNYVGMFRHESGNIYVSLNGGAEASAASGTSDGIGGGQGAYLASSSAGIYFNGRIGQIVCWNVALTGTDLSNSITYMINKWV